MNIFIVAEAFYPDGWGGAHTYVYQLAKHLERSDRYQSTVLTISERRTAAARDIIEGIKVYRYQSAITGACIALRRPLLSAFNAYRLFRKLLADRPCDIINFHAVLPALGILFFGRIKKIAKVYTFHSSLFEDVRLQLKKKKYMLSIFNKVLLISIKFIERYVLNKCDIIIVLSNFSKEYLKTTYRIPEEKMVVVPGGVDIDTFKPQENRASLRNKLNLPDNKIILLTARRLVARMGLENLIYAIKEIIVLRTDIHLLIIGEGFLRKELEKLTVDENLCDYITFLGAKDTQELAVYYQVADLFIMPSEHAEWFGLSTVEALASGTPVAGTPAGATAEILRGLDNVLVFEGTGAKAIKNGICSLIDGNDRLKRLRGQSRQYAVDNYSWRRIFSDVEAVYSRFTNK